MYIIGDIHGKYKSYSKLISKMDYSVQLGDFGFNYDILNSIDSNKHVFFPGNHDNHTLAYKSNNCLGKFGQRELGGVPFFFISGGHSIDQKARTPGLDYFPNEELSDKELDAAYQEYKNTKPKLMITHEIPYKITRTLFPNTSLIEAYGYSKTWASKTSKLLQKCLDYHQPKIWLCGHFHQNKRYQFENTTFIVLAELAYIKIDLEQLK